MLAGLTLIPDFVDAFAEADLLAHVEHTPVERASGRSRGRFGAAVYQDRRLDTGIPDWLVRLGSKMPMPAPDEVTINVWAPGAYLAHHADKGGPIICVLSLLGAGALQFLLPSSMRQAGATSHVTVPCCRRGLLVMTGPARYACTHAVIPTPEPRVSIVFRTIA